jgi:hypothetical protein
MMTDSKFPFMVIFSKDALSGEAPPRVTPAEVCALKT